MHFLVGRPKLLYTCKRCYKQYHSRFVLKTHMKEILTSKKLESKEFIRFYYNINKPVLDLLSFAEVWISGIDFSLIMKPFIAPSEGNELRKTNPHPLTKLLSTVKDISCLYTG